MCLLFMTIVISSDCLAQDGSKGLKMQEVQRYRYVAHRIFDRITALKDRYPHLALIENTVQKEEAEDKLWIAYHYAHGVSRIRNPDYNPRTKGGRTVKSFSSGDGIEINLYFYEGEWPGQAAVRPINIGAMKIVSFIEGAKTPSVAALQHDIAEIMTDEKAKFQRPAKRE